MENNENGTQEVQKKDGFKIPSSFESQAEEIFDPDKEGKVEFQTT